MKKIGTVFLALIGLGFITLGVIFLFKGIEAQNWPSADGTIQEKYVSKISRSGSNPSFKPVVNYTYTVDGEEYSNNRLTIISETHGKKAAAEARITDYQSGDPVKVYYNPNRPGDSILNPEPYRFAYVIIIFGVILCVTAAFILLRKKST